MKRFLKNCTLFILPIIIVFAILSSILYYSGELISKGDVAPLHSDQLLGLAYSEINQPYKYEMTEILQPDVVALGSSRIMQVKENIIADHLSFYNAGGAVNNVYQYKYFLDNLSFKPKLLILNIDQWFFNPNFENQREVFDPDCYTYRRDNIGLLCYNLANDMAKGKIDCKLLFNRDNTNIGINAKIKNNGFMRDGSYHHGSLIKNPQSGDDYNFRDTYSRIDMGDRRFQYCDSADRTMVHPIDSFLAECCKRNIKVVAFLPPFAPLVYKKMESTGHYGYISQIYDMLLPVFRKYRHCFLYDYSDVTPLAVHNYDFIDGFHGSSLIYNKIIKDILKKNNMLNQFFIACSAIDSINHIYSRKRIRYHGLK